MAPPGYKGPKGNCLTVIAVMLGLLAAVLVAVL